MLSNYVNLRQFLASRGECPRSLCHSPGVSVGVRVGVGGVDKTVYLDHNFPTITDLILHMRIPCDKTFHLVLEFLESKGILEGTCSQVLLSTSVDL